MKRNLLLGLALALLATLSAALLLRLGGAETPSEAGVSPTDGSPTRAAPAEGPATSEGSEPVASDQRDTAVGAVELPSSAQGPRAELIEVELVRADDGQPVPHARVSWWPIAAPFSGTGDFESWLRGSAVEAKEAAAVRLQADRQGRVWVSDAERGFVVVARTAELWGYATFGLDFQRPAQVRLAPDLNLRVQVVDEQGRALAGVPVVLREQFGLSHRDHLTARTQEPNGLALLSHARPFLERGVGPNPVFVVAVPGLFDAPVERPVPLGTLAGEVLKLVLPPTGSCEVVVEDESGEPVLGEMQVQLRFTSRAAEAGRESMPRGETLRSADGGRVLFEHVALGRELLGAVTHHRSLSPDQVRGPGPTRPGERVELRASVGGDMAIWRGRLLDPSGAPLGNATAAARLEALDPDCQFEGTAGAWTVRTAEDGRFAVLTLPMAERPEGLMVVVFGLSESGAPVSMARAQAPEDVGSGVRELGDLQLRELPVAVEGEVVDGQGEPVAGATVTADVPLTPDAPEPERVRWPPRLQVPLTDRSGRFELRGQVASAQLALTARKGELTGETVLVRTGTRGVRLVLQPGGALEGRVLLDPGVLSTPVLVEVVPASPSPIGAGSSRGASARLGADGRFAVRGLVPGPYAVRIVHESTEQELGSVSGVVVVGGETTRDPRLDPLDLRRNTRFVELTLLDEWGRPVPGARVFSRPSGDAQAAWLCTQAPGGQVRLLADARPLDVSIVATGFLTKELEVVDTAQRVTLARAGQLRFQLAAGLPLPEAPVQLEIEVLPLGGARPAQPGDWGAVRFDARGQASCDIPGAGRLQLRLSVQLDGDSSGSVRSLEVTPDAIAVTEGGGDQLVELRFDPDQLAAAVRALKGQ